MVLVLGLFKHAEVNKCLYWANFIFAIPFMSLSLLLYYNCVHKILQLVLFLFMHIQANLIL